MYVSLAFSLRIVFEVNLFLLGSTKITNLTKIVLQSFIWGEGEPGYVPPKGNVFSHKPFQNKEFIDNNKIKKLTVTNFVLINN